VSGDGKRKVTPGLLAGGGCYTCGGPHFKTDSDVWRKTKEGQAWLATDVGKVATAREQHASSEQANGARVMAEDTDSESEMSTYRVSPATVNYACKANPGWYLDSCASCHITGQRDLFQGNLRHSTKRIPQVRIYQEMVARGTRNTSQQQLQLNASADWECVF
jgi:hypothetical protein